MAMTRAIPVCGSGARCGVFAMSGKGLPGKLRGARDAPAAGDGLQDHGQRKKQRAERRRTHSKPKCFNLETNGRGEACCARARASETGNL